MSRCAAILALSLLLPLPAGAGELHNLSDGRTRNLAEILPRLAEASVILLGERHTDPRHHRMQLEVVRALHQEAGVTFTLAVEMVRRADQPALDRWVAGEVREAEFARVFEANWKGTWPLYRDLFVYARDHRIPMLGLNLPPGITAKVASRGFSSLTAAEREEIRGASCDVDDRYRDYIRRALGKHGSEEQFQRFCEAQMVWDTTMAWRIARHREENPGRLVVALAGLVHAWKHGIPAQLPQVKGEGRLVAILPLIPGAFDLGTITAADADYLWLGGSF